MALNYAKNNFSTFIKQNDEKNQESNYLESILLLIAFENPKESSEAHYLDLKFQSQLAHDINVAIIQYIEPLKEEAKLIKLFRSLYYTENEICVSEESNGLSEEKVQENQSMSNF